MVRKTRQMDKATWTQLAYGAWLLPRRRKAAKNATPSGFLEFLAVSIRTRSGPFSFAGHRALEPIAATLADPTIPRIDILKATQIGMTTLAGFGYALWEAAANGHNVGYFLPTEKMAREMVGQRLRHATCGDLTAHLRVVMDEGIVVVSHPGTGDGRIYTRGLHSVLGAISVPLDVNLYDEVDDLDREHFLWARQRLDGSQYAREIAFACGRYPGEGMDARFLEGTQHHWHLRCPACGRDDQVPELLFPENVRRIDGAWRVVCVACGRPLDVEVDGRWVAHYPDRESRSYRVSALVIPHVRLDRIMREWRAAEREQRLLAPFRSSKLALPDAADRQALTVEDLARAVGDPAAAQVPATPAYVGIDTGDWCHLAVVMVGATDKLAYVYFERTSGEALVDRLRTLASRFSFAGILIDQRPEGAIARAVCRAFPSIAFLQQFGPTEAEKVKPLAGEAFHVLAFEREETLGAWCDLVRRMPPGILFPRAVENTDFLASDVVRHILAGAQRVEAADATGGTVLRFRSGAVENHWFMACVFAWRIMEHLCGRRIGPGDIGLVGERTMVEL